MTKTTSKSTAQLEREILEKARPKRPPVSPMVKTMQDLMGDMSVADVYYSSWVSKGTIKRLRDGITRNPTSMTCTGIAAARGYEMRFVRKPR